MKYFIELWNGEQFETDEWSYNKLFRNKNQNSNICFIEKMRMGFERKVCVPIRNISYFYTINEIKNIEPKGK